MIQELATAWLQGAAVTFLIGLTVVQLIALIAILAKRDAFSLRIGPLQLFEYEGRSGKTIFALTFRGELLILGLIGGLIYALAALLLSLM